MQCLGESNPPVYPRSQGAVAMFISYTHGRCWLKKVTAWPFLVFLQACPPRITSPTIPLDTWKFTYLVIFRQLRELDRCREGISYLAASRSLSHPDFRFLFTRTLWLSFTEGNNRNAFEFSYPPYAPWSIYPSITLLKECRNQRRSSGLTECWNLIPPLVWSIYG